MATLTPVLEESSEEFTEARANREPLRRDAALPDESINSTHRTSYSQVERDIVTLRPRSPADPIAPTATMQADPCPTQDSSSISVARPVLNASPVDCSEDILREILEPRIPDRPRRKHRQRDHWGHQSRHSRSLQHDSRASGRPDKDKGLTVDRTVKRKREKRPARTPEQRKPQPGRPRKRHERGRKPRSSLKQRLVGIMRVLLAAFGGLERQKPRRRQRSSLRGKRFA